MVKPELKEILENNLKFNGKLEDAILNPYTGKVTLFTTKGRYNMTIPDVKLQNIKKQTLKLEQIMESKPIDVLSNNYTEPKNEYNQTIQLVKKFIDSIEDLDKIEEIENPEWKAEKNKGFSFKFNKDISRQIKWWLKRVNDKTSDKINIKTHIGRYDSQNILYINIFLNKKVYNKALYNREKWYDGPIF